jgi:hypothetical protein
MTTYGILEMVSIGRDIATFGKIREKHLELAT